MSEVTRSTHPAFIVAAVAVTLASAVVIANVAGLLPGKGTPEPTAASASTTNGAGTTTAEQVAPPTTAGVPAGSPGNQAKPAPGRRAAPAGGYATSGAYAPAGGTGDLRYASDRSTQYGAQPGNDAGIDVIPAPPPGAPPMCRECGYVESIREVSAPAEASGVGAVAGGVVGGLLGNQVGHGKGNTAATIVGAVGGAFAGHQAEKYVRADKQYQVAVRFEDGSQRVFTQKDSRWHVGDRVRLAGNGGLMPN